MKSTVIKLLIIVFPVTLSSCNNIEFATDNPVKQLMSLFSISSANGMTTPTAPDNLDASALSYTEIQLTWEDTSANKTGFRIERRADGESEFTEVATDIAPETIIHTDAGLDSDTTYHYRVTAFNAFGESSYSNEASATTSETVPFTPESLVATKMSSSRIDLTWEDNSSNESGFIIQRSLNNSVYTQIATVSANCTAYSNTGLDSNTTYYYRVRAYNANGNSGYSNISTATTDDVVPAAPSGLTATAASSTRINLSWMDNSNNESGFVILRSPDNSVYTEIATVSANTTTYGNTGLTASTTYYYRVNAYNAIGNSGYTAANATTHDASAASQIVADHTVVASYTDIPNVWINEVKKMWINILGESHSEAYRTGLDLLEQQDSRFAVNITAPSPNDPTPPEAYTDQHLRVSRALWDIYSWWSYWGVGEDIWYTWYASNTSGGEILKNHFSYCYNNNYGRMVTGFGWCWDMTWINGPGGTVDPVYHVRWAGSSEGGPNGNARWGLDSGDYALTGNSVCMDTYLNATEAYRNYCETNGYTATVIFTTGPVDGYTGESGYQRHLKHEYIREFVEANSDRILFDYADILCYDDNGNQNLTSWTDSTGVTHTYPVITSTNLGDESVGHIGPAGAIRLAKAQWWMLARIAGWDGQ